MLANGGSDEFATVVAADVLGNTACQNRVLKMLSTPSVLALEVERSVTHSRVNSSVMASHFSGRPIAVWSWIEFQAQTS